MEQKLLELLNEIYPVDFIKVEAVTNEMFRCTATQGEYFARITNYKGYDEQLEEVTYTNYLHNEGLGVSPAIVSIKGRVVEKITLNKKELLTVLYESAAGNHLPRNEWNANVLKELGRQIGKLHRLSRKFEEIHPTRYINDWYENEEYAFLKYIPEEENTIRDVA